jgi:flagellar basal-body rod modification protein FlgD
MSTTPATSSASDLQTDYMSLLVTQLRNQNPLEPMNNNDMSAQLAQYSQLQQLENMNSSFGQLLSSVQRTQASTLLGKTVSFTTTDSNGATKTQEGKVEGVTIGSKGDVLLQVGKQQVKLADVTEIRE